MAKPETTVDLIRRIRSINITNYREAAYAIQEAAALADRAFQVAFPAVVAEGEKDERVKAKEALKRKKETAAQAEATSKFVEEIVEAPKETGETDEKTEKAKSTRRRVAKIKEAMDVVPSMSEKKEASSEESNSGVSEEQAPESFEETKE